MHFILAFTFDGALRMISLVDLVSSSCYLLADDFFDIGKSRLFEPMLLDERLYLGVDIAAVVNA
jgi:hypothetical protein